MAVLWSRVAGIIILVQKETGLPPYVRPTKLIGLRLPEDLHAQLAAIAKEEDRSIAYIIKRLIADGLAREAKKMKR
jgi:predicted HicB family RNase H-like nuclease